MAIIMAKNNSWVILESLLGDTQAFQKAKYLQTLGAVLKVGLFSVTITVNGQEFTDTMPVALTSLTAANDQVKTLAVGKVSKIIEDALVASAGPAPAGSVAASNPQPEVLIVPEAPSSPAWMQSIPPTAKEVKAVKAAQAATENPAVAAPPPPPGFAAWQADNAPKAPSTPVKPKPTKDVVKLKDARAISQRVHGTSSGSVYRVAAVGLVNIAIREQTGTVSVRAEFQQKPSSDIVSKLTDIGFSGGGSGAYWSMHIGLTNGAPTMRVVGSILLGAGIEFDQIATTMGQINHD